MIHSNLSYFYVVAGILCSQKISVGGEMFIGELLSFFVVFVNINKLYTPKLMKSMLGLIIIWICAQIISDIVNDTAFINTIKGTGAPLFLIITTLACTHYFRNKTELIPYFFLGIVIGLWLSMSFGNPYYVYNPWKWGMGRAIALSLLIYFSYWYRGKKNIVIYAAILFLFVSLLQSSRSLGGMLLLSVIIYFGLKRINNLKKWRHIKSKKITTISIILIAIFVVVILNFVLGILFTSDWFLTNLPDEDAQKYRIQAASDLGVVLGGRSEIVVSLEAFLDKPLFGHGSWPENYDYMYRYIDIMDLLGSSQLDYKTAISLVTSGLIPSHSYLMGALIWGGIFAGLFWLFIIYKIFDVIVKQSHTLSLLQVYLSITTLWNILFSPFGADARWLTALTLWIIFFTSNKNSYKRR